MNNKKKYTKPQIEVVMLNDSDLICTSLGLNDEEAGGPQGARGFFSDDYDE